ncbi:ATP-binding cassette, subfamily B (MDR/TAP), member 8 [Sarotherodon galilaeus]
MSFSLSMTLRRLDQGCHLRHLSKCWMKEQPILEGLAEYQLMPSVKALWSGVLFEVDRMCKEPCVSCPACTPDVLAVSVDGNCKLYRFQSNASTSEQANFEGVFIEKDEEVAEFMKYIQRHTNEVAQLRNLLSMRPFLSVMHAKALIWKCEIKWGGAFQDGAGSTTGKEVEQVNRRTDMLTLLALGWTKRKVEQLGRSLSQRYLKIIRILREQVESLNATKNELGVDDDTLQQWVANVQKWAEDSNKRRHRIRKVILDEQKRLAAAVDDYNKLAEPTKQIVFSDALIQTDIWPWQSTSEPAAELQTKRKVFEKVMAVRHLREEEMILCREMRHHWTVLRMRSVVLGTISSDSSLVGMSEDAQKGLHSLVLKKQSELKAEMLKVKDMYKRILSHQPLLEMDSEEEEDIPDDATENESRFTLSTCDRVWRRRGEPSAACNILQHDGLAVDNARPHVAGVCQQFLQDEGIDAVDWPTRSPDLNAIEDIWDIMSRSIHQLQHKMSRSLGGDPSGEHLPLHQEHAQVL